MKGCDNAEVHCELYLASEIKDNKRTYLSVSIAKED